MKLIKLKEDHYIIVDDSEIKIGCIVAEKLVNGSYEMFTIHTLNDITSSCQNVITHSTQPLGFLQIEGITTSNLKPTYGSAQPLTLSEVKELLGEVDVEKKVKDYVQELIDCKSVKEHERTWISAICHQMYTQALEDNKDKKYTEEDMGKIFYVGVQLGINQELYAQLGKPLQNEEEVLDRTIKSLRPKTEWEVEFIDGKLKLKS